MEAIKNFFGKKKSLGLIAGVSMIGAYEFSRIYVPGFVENHFTYRINCLIENSLSKLARLLGMLNLESEPIVLRNILNNLLKAATNRVQYSNVNITDSFANNTRIRIYSPKDLNSEELSPAMIYYHGGGYVLLSIDPYDNVLIDLADKLKMIIVSIDYPLAPESKYPAPIEEAFAATSYFLNNFGEYDLNIDTNRIILAGDSAGGSMATIISNRLITVNENIPKLQALIYPPTQYLNFMLPSSIQHSKLDRMTPRPKLALWHLGLANLKEEHLEVLVKNQQTLLLDENLMNKFKTYLDISLIPEIYKKNKTYYNFYDRIQNLVYPDKLEENSILKKDADFGSLLKNLINTNISPGLADEETLKNHPKTLIIVSEWDSRKDEALIYAERLSRCGVSVDIAFHENGYHGSFNTNSDVGKSMRSDLVNFINQNL